MNLLLILQLCLSIQAQAFREEPIAGSNCPSIRSKCKDQHRNEKAHNQAQFDDIFARKAGTDANLAGREAALLAFQKAERPFHASVHLSALEVEEFGDPISGKESPLFPGGPYANEVPVLNLPALTWKEPARMQRLARLQREIEGWRSQIESRAPEKRQLESEISQQKLSSSSMESNLNGLLAAIRANDSMLETGCHNRCIGPGGN